LKRKRDAKKKAKQAQSTADHSAEEDINLDNYDEAMTKKTDKKSKKKGKNGAAASEELDEDEKRRLQDLELMFAGEEGADAGTDRLRYSKKEFEKAAKNKGKESKKKKNKKQR
jgi:hypothetical protein